MWVKELERYLKQSGTVMDTSQGYLTVIITRLEHHVITEEMLVSTVLVSLLLCRTTCHAYTYTGVTPDNCTNDQLRLVNGFNKASGRVEICRHGCWGTVCDDTWDRDDAAIACSQLGFVRTAQRAIPTRGAYFGEGSGPIHLSQAHCDSQRDNQTRLVNCEIDKDGINNCSHSEDAGVICGKEISDMFSY